MNRIFALPLSALLIAAMFGAAAAKPRLPDRLPGLVRTNSFIVGQALGCVIRYESYAAMTTEALQATGTSIPAQLEDLNVLFDVDVLALKTDLTTALSALSEGAIDPKTFLGTIEKLAQAELAGGQVASGAYPAWLQVAGCFTLLRQLGLSQAYPGDAKVP